MDYRALAVDFDETLARGGQVAPPTRDALRRVRDSGCRLLLVTGRELGELLQIFDGADLFDRIIAENGALLFNPGNRTSRLLAPPAPADLLAALTRRRVPFQAGRCLISTVEPHEHAVLEAIHELRLEWHVIFNKGAVMVLPSTVTKSTGLSAALDDLSLRAEQTVGVGDAENDQAFLRACGLSVSVANGLPSLKSCADLVTQAENGQGVIELAGRLLAGTLSRERGQLADERNTGHRP